MFKEEFNSNIDFNNLIATEESFQYDIKETYPVCYLIDLYLNNSFSIHKKETNLRNNRNINGFNFVSIKARTIENILGRTILTRLDKEHLFFKVFEVDNNYKFYKDNVKESEREESYTKAYKLSTIFICKMLLHKLTLRKSMIYSFNKFKIKEHYLIKGFSFNNRNEILKSKIITRKEFDLNKEKYKGYYNSIVAKKYNEETFSHVNTETTKIDYFHEPNIDTEYVLSKVEDISAEDINNLSEYQMLEYVRMTMKAKINDSGSKRQLYTRHGSGRLIGVQIPHQNVNFQVLPKWEREIFFTGKFEYDMSNAVITLFTNIFEKLGGKRELKTIKDYMLDKNKYRNYLVKLGFSEKLAKQYFITILYGKDLSNNIQESYKNTDWMQEVNEELFYKALENENVENLLKELDYLKDFLVNHYKEVSSKDGLKYIIRNANNCYKSFTKFEMEKNKGKVLAHIFFGMESLIMDFIKNNFETNLLIYDGFISEEDIDTKYLELLIEHELGYKIKFTKRKIGGINEN